MPRERKITPEDVAVVQRKIGDLSLDFANSNTPLQLMPIAMAIFAERMEAITGLPSEDFLQEARNTAIQMKIDKRDKIAAVTPIINPQFPILNADGNQQLPMPEPPEGTPPT